MAGTSIGDTVAEFLQIDSITDISVLDKRIPIGKRDGEVCYRNRKTIKVNIDFTKDVSWLDTLSDNLTIQIEDTFYNKTGANFKYDYLRQSSDYNSNLSEYVEHGEIYIMVNNGLTDETC